jgi:large subunit ribosomal protein L29
MSKTIAEIRELTDEQLLDAIEDNREEARVLRFNRATGELKNLNLINQNKRELARLKTVLTQRRLAAEKVSGEGK